MWNPTKTNFTSYKASLSNNTFINKFRIPGAVSNFSVTNLTAGGIYNFTLRRLQGNIEGASAFIEIVTGLYGFFFSLLVNGSCRYQFYTLLALCVSPCSITQEFQGRLHVICYCGHGHTLFIPYATCVKWYTTRNNILCLHCMSFDHFYYLHYFTGLHPVKSYAQIELYLTWFQ